MNPKQRISYFPLDGMDAEMRKEMERCQREGTPRPESSAVRAHVPGAFWERMHRHFSEPELVELGCFTALTMGQQSWLRLLSIEHHQVLAGTSASMAPGFESADSLRQSKSSSSYWAKQGAEKEKDAA